LSGSHSKFTVLFYPDVRQLHNDSEAVCPPGKPAANKQEGELFEGIYQVAMKREGSFSPSLFIF
jgi:hypothetical protein